MLGAGLQPKPDSLTALQRTHAAGVQRYLRVLVGDEDLARDLAQDTFVRLLPHADEAGTALVFTVARSCALDHLRRRRTRARHESAFDQSRLEAVPAAARHQPDRDLENDQLRDDLLTALAALPEDQRSAFHLSEIEGLSYAEIADILDVSPGTIASRKHHAVRKLREHLRRRGHGA